MLNPLHTVCTTFERNVCTVVSALASLAQLGSIKWLVLQPVLITALKDTDQLNPDFDLGCGLLSLVAQELLRDVFRHTNSYYTLDWWAIVTMASLVTTFSLLTALFVSGNEVCCIQTVTLLILVASSLASFLLFSLFLTHLHPLPSPILLNVKMLTHSWS